MMVEATHDGRSHVQLAVTLRVQSGGVDVARVVLSTGREITLSRIEIKGTYGGMLEGYPCAKLNDRMILGPARQRHTRTGGAPVHLIEPDRTYPDEPPGPLGPVELLPAFTCTGFFRSGPVDPSHSVLWRSWLTVIWFEPDLDSPITQMTATAVGDLDWDSLAEDTEL